jgi:hypothetical protein
MYHCWLLIRNLSVSCLHSIRSTDRSNSTYIVIIGRGNTREVEAHQEVWWNRSNTWEQRAAADTSGGLRKVDTVGIEVQLAWIRRTSRCAWNAVGWILDQLADDLHDPPTSKHHQHHQQDHDQRPRTTYIVVVVKVRRFIDNLLEPRHAEHAIELRWPHGLCWCGLRSGKGSKHSHQCDDKNEFVSHDGDTCDTDEGRNKMSRSRGGRKTLWRIPEAWRESLLYQPPLLFVLVA